VIPVLHLARGARTPPAAPPLPASVPREVALTGGGRMLAALTVALAAGAIVSAVLLAAT
jgi:hypothetical protein